MKYLFVYFVTAAAEMTDDYRAKLMNLVLELNMHKVPFLAFYDNGQDSARQSAKLVIKTMGFVAAQSQSNDWVGVPGERDKILEHLKKNQQATGGELLSNFGGALNEVRRGLLSFIKKEAQKLTEQELENYNICVVGDPLVLATAVPHPASFKIPGVPEIWQWLVSIDRDGEFKIINVVRRG